MASDNPARNPKAPAVFACIAAVCSAVCAIILTYIASLQWEEQRKQTDFFAKQTAYMRGQITPSINYDSVVLHVYPNQLTCELKGLANRGMGAADNCTAFVCFRGEGNMIASFYKMIGYVDAKHEYGSVVIPMNSSIEVGRLPISTMEYIKKNGIEIRFTYLCVATQEQMTTIHKEDRWTEAVMK
jgi:uncharacterized protein YsxB (DUF464 family)